MYFAPDFKIKMKLTEGKILISDPFLQDPNFQRTIIGLTEHNENGSIGFVLNKPLGLYLNDVITDLTQFKSHLFYGGPVQPDTLHFIHKLGILIEGSKEITEGVFWGGNFETVKIMIENKKCKPNDFRFFLGYSGWAPEQLDDELKNKSWLVAEGRSNYFFSQSPKELWGEVLNNIGSKYSVMAQFADTPSLN